MREPPAFAATGDRRPATDALQGWLIDLAALAALALFVTAAQLWCGGLAG